MSSNITNTNVFIPFAASNHAPPPTELLSLIGNAPSSFIYCPNIDCSRIGSTYQQHEQHPWAITMTCPCASPPTQWYICTICSNQRVKMTRCDQLKKHNRLRHDDSKKRKQPIHTNGTVFSCNDSTTTSYPATSDMNIFIDDNHVDQTILNLTVPELPLPATIQFNFIPEIIYQKYYWYENYTQLHGLAYLIQTALSQNSEMQLTLPENVVLLHFHLAKLCYSITRSNRQLLSLVLANICNSAPLHINCNNQSISIPKSMSAIRSTYLEGRFSLINNIPIPQHETIGPFTYVSLLSCISHMFASGIDIVHLNKDMYSCNKVTYLYESKKCNNLFEKSSIFGTFDCVSYIIEWSDSFDPNTSTKSNRGSVYVKSVTFARPNSSKFPSSFYTFPVCIGPSKANKTEVEKRFSAELDLFKSHVPLSFYDGRSKSMKTVYIDLLCTLQDQPERRASMYLMMGNSKFAPRWGYALDYKCLQNVIPSCPKCVSMIVQRGESCFDCQTCLSWSDNPDHPLLRFAVPKHFPKNTLLSVDGHLMSSQKLSTKLLIDAVSLVHQKVLNNEWSENESRAYLTVYGINMDYATNVFASVLENNPVPLIPPTWQRNTCVSDHLETIMHLLFLGVVKSFLGDIHDFLRKNLQFTSYISEMKVALIPIIEMRLSWCKLITYGTGKFGGHVSENYLAMARILKWLCCYLCKFDAKKGIDISIMKDVVCSLYGMLTRLMQRSTNDLLNKSIERHVKLFLDYYVKMDRLMNGDKNVGWIKKYNFLSLLNLHHQIQDFGPLLNTWEGGFMGEKIISTMKPEIKSGLRKNWNTNLFKKIARKRFFEMTEFRITKSGDFNDSESRPSNKYRYDNYNTVQNAIQQGLPIEVHYHPIIKSLLLVLNGGQYYEVISKGLAITVMGTSFHYIECIPQCHKFLEEKSVLVSSLLLPYKDVFSDIHLQMETTPYYIITADWNEYSHDYFPTISRVENVSYTDTLI